MYDQYSYDDVNGDIDEDEELLLKIQGITPNNRSTIVYDSNDKAQVIVIKPNNDNTNDDSKKRNTIKLEQSNDQLGVHMNTRQRKDKHFSIHKNEVADAEKEEYTHAQKKKHNRKVSKKLKSSLKIKFEESSNGSMLETNSKPDSEDIVQSLDIEHLEFEVVKVARNLIETEALSKYDQVLRIFPKNCDRKLRGQKKTLFHCNYCNFSSFHQYAITHHSLYKHPFTDEWEYKCKECPQVFRNKTGLQLHENRHKGIKPHQCPFCIKRYTVKTNVRTHIKAVHSKIDLKIECPQCDKKFISKSILYLHFKNRHCTDYRYWCDSCSRGFHWLSKLRVHKRSHTGEKPFVCDECNRRFGTYYAMKNHRYRIHRRLYY